MKIGIEAERANSRIKTGVEHYAKQLILQFAELDRENEYMLYLRTEPEEWIRKLPANFKFVVMPFPLFWTQIRLAWEMFRRAPDILFIPASSMPLFRPKRTVVTVHDEAFMYYPETYTAFQRYFHMFCDVLVSVLADKIIAVSEATKKDFMKFWKVSEQRVSVVHHGYSPMQKAVSTGEKTAIEDTLPEKYVLFLSTLQPRKNVERLIDAFALLKKRNPEFSHKLVIAGKPGWKSEQILEYIERNKEFVVYLNHVSDEQRAVLYAGASALCVPSLYEGFGMWILEAFDAGVPVITSSVSSMPEVGGDACEYCDPRDTQAIAAALERVVLNPARGDELIRHGRERLALFSWRRCAEQTLRILTSK